MLFRDVWGVRIPFQEVLGCLGHSSTNQPKSFKSEHFNYPGLAGSLGKVMEAHSLKKETFHMFQTNPPSIFQARCSNSTVCEDSSKKMSETRGMLIASVPRSRQRNLRLKDQRRSLKYIAFKYECIYICYIYLNPCYWYCWCFKVMLKTTIYGRVIIVIHGHVLENIWGLPK